MSQGAQLSEDAKLVAKVVAALKAYDAADAVKKEKAIILGGCLAEAQKRHPSTKAFEEFLKQAGGIQIRRAQDLIAIALGRRDFDRHQADRAAAQQRLRDKQKAERIEREKAKAALPKPKPKPDAPRDASSEPEPKPTPDHDAQLKPSDASKPKPPRNDAMMAGKRIADLLDELAVATSLTIHWINDYPPSRIYDLKDKDLDRLIDGLNGLKKDRRKHRAKRVIMRNSAQDAA